MYSVITSKGQTTIPADIRAALGAKPGDRLEYTIKGKEVVVRVHPGLRSLRGKLARKGQKYVPLAKVRAALDEKVRRGERL